MAGTHGGARPGAGRKPKRVKFPAEVEALDKRLAAHQEKAARNLIKLADGGYKRVTKVWKPAGLIQIVRTELAEGPQGPKILRYLEPAFPNIEDPTTLVCIEQRVEVAEPDRAANEFIIERIAGRVDVFDDPQDESQAPEITDETRKSAMEKLRTWRQSSQTQLASIRNPMTGEAAWDSESTSDSSSNPESQTTDEF